jgi:hypothetical protein
MTRYVYFIKGDNSFISNPELVKNCLKYLLIYQDPLISHPLFREDVLIFHSKR